MYIYLCKFLFCIYGYMFFFIYHIYIHILYSYMFFLKGEVHYWMILDKYNSKWSKSSVCVRWRRNFDAEQQTHVSAVGALNAFGQLGKGWSWWYWCRQDIDVWWWWWWWLWWWLAHMMFVLMTLMVMVLVLVLGADGQGVDSQLFHLELNFLLLWSFGWLRFGTEVWQRLLQEASCWNQVTTAKSEKCGECKRKSLLKTNCVSELPGKHSLTIYYKATAAVFWG